MKFKAADLRYEVEKIAAAAGDKIMHYYRRPDLQVIEKSDRSPVTSADLAASDMIVEALNNLTPGVPVLSEENADEAKAALIPASKERYWLVDPLDGTKDFLAGTGEFTVNIALVENGMPILGVMQVPVSRAVYAGCVGEPAIKRLNIEAPAMPIHARVADLENFHVLLSRFHRQGEVLELQKRFPGCKITHVGSSLKYALIAEGAADLAFRRGKTKLWDTAAAVALLKSAGAQVCHLDGTPLRYDSRDLTHPGFMVLGDRKITWRDILG